MKIQTMFEKDINRDINGVIKVRQDDEHSLQQNSVSTLSPKNYGNIFGRF